MKLFIELERNWVNTLEFNEAIKDLSLNYSVQDKEVINIFVNESEKILNSRLTLVKDSEHIHFYKTGIEGTKKVNITPNLMKKIMNNLSSSLTLLSKHKELSRAKDHKFEKKIIEIEVLKKNDFNFTVKTVFGNANLPFDYIPHVDIDKYIIGSKHFGVVHSYSFKNQDCLINCKTPAVELQKVKTILLNSNVTRVNRYYGIRIKIYIDKIPEKTIISNLKLFYPKEKIIFVKRKKDE